MSQMGSNPDFLLGGPYVRFRAVQTLVREGSPLVCAILLSRCRRAIGKRLELSRGRSRWRRSKLPVATLIVGALSTVYRCRSMAATASVL